MGTLHLVLVEPQIPQNTGNIARTCAVTGAHLHLVEPLGFTIDDKKLKRAGLDYWHTLNITRYPDFDAFFRQTNAPCYFFTTKTSRLYTEIAYPKEVYLVFGREDAGLPAHIRGVHEQNCLRLPMLPNQRSLNLSNSVAVAAFEVLRQWNFPGLE